MTKKPLTSVLELARLTADSDDDLKPLEALIRERQVIKKLIAIRAAKGLSQQDIANKMGVSQSKISKLEASHDNALSLGDFRDYLGAIGLDLRLIVCPQKWSAAEQIKFYVRQIRGCLQRLVNVAKNTSDQVVRAGIQQFHVEAMVNMLVPVIKSAASLPNLTVDAPEIVDAGFHVDDDLTDQPQPDGPVASVH